MRQSGGIGRTVSLVVVFVLLALDPRGARAQEMVLMGFGPMLEDPSIAQALVQAVDWSELTDSVYGDPDLPVVLIPQAGEPVDNYSLQFDPKLAHDLLAGFELTLLYIYAPDLAEVAAGIADSLWGMDVGIAIIEAGSEGEVNDYLRETADGNALLVSYRR